MQRRDLLLTGLLSPWMTSRALAAPFRADDPLMWSAERLSQALRTRSLGVVEFAEAAIRRVEATRGLNAFITFDPDQVLRDARAVERDRHHRSGSLYGVPIPVKDSVNTAQYPTSGGTAALRHFRPAVDAPVVARLRAEGAFILGKTNLHELSYGWTSNNLAFGAVHNPYGLDRIPGGSSGGSAAAVAARLAPFAIAEDTEGSIRVPAALCGLAGFRPTTGRYSTEGAIPISPLFDQIGPVASHAGDLVLFDRLMSRRGKGIYARNLKGVRFGVVSDPFWRDLHPDVEASARGALRRLQDAGAVIVETDWPELDAMVAAICEPIQNHDVRIALADFLKRYGAPADFDGVVAAASADIQAVFRHDILPGSPGFIDAPRYREMVDVQLPALRRAYADLFTRLRVTAVVFPTTRVSAPRIGEEDAVDIGGRQIDFSRAIAGNIAPGSTVGLPGLVLPMGLDPQGLPLSLEFDGPAGSDRDLLALAVALEETLGRLPPPQV
jgi:indoleacetamide hydrolase